MSTSIMTPANLSPQSDSIISEPNGQNIPKSDQPFQTTPQEQRESLFLQNRDGNTVELTAAKLDQWFANLELNQEKAAQNTPDDPTMAIQFLGRFGLQSAEDVISFLNSPAGEITQKIIGERLAEIAAMEDFKRQYYLDEQSRHNRLLAFLLLGLIYKKHAKARHQHELMQQQIDKILHHNEHHITDEHTVHAPSEMLEQQLAAFEESAKILEATLRNKEVEKELLNRELHAINKQDAIITTRYSVFDKNLAEHENFSNSNLNNSEEKSKFITARIAHFEKTLDTQADKISDLIAQDRHEEAQKLLHDHNGLHLQVAALKDMHAIIHSQKKLYNSDGEETSTLKDAAYILTPNQKLVKSPAGKYFLIGIHQDLAAMSDTEKAQAQTKFEKSLPEISNLKNLVTHNLKLEKEFVGQRRQSAMLRGKDLQSEVTLLTNQLSQIKAAHANVAAELRKPNASLNKALGLQQPMPNMSSTAAKPQAAIAQTIALLKEMARNPNVINVNNFKNSLKAYTLDVMTQQNLNKIMPGRPIPIAIMKNLHGFLDRAALSQTIQEPTCTVQTNPSKLPTPSPFNR